ncbi:DUF305 domain-containing protein [Streptomyces sp. 549]|uniref:DUF305 domain-containing protein n=1 Tax=Streptomyces sp. 549 TaxID=3049076 RepID=UPI0024C3EAE7|nr:DUF305 domain-containing protein [Streptomyces sp. 549]MDK1474698.1 DUF305 domain-containing protein [Streptomyces sp. 549]
MTDRHRVRPIAVLALLLAALPALTSCTGGSADAAGDEPGVLAPGRPGEDARTLSPDEAREVSRKQTQPNGADFTFMTMMIEHHEQALVMAELAEEHAEGERVGKLADRIRAAQKPEISVMRAWLKRNNADSRSGGHDHHHGEMAGMATEAQLERLGKARGAAFDRMFLSLMITHHQGAVTMAEEVLKDGNDVTVEEMATEIAAQQNAEVARMRALR